MMKTNGLLIFMLLCTTAFGESASVYFDTNTLSQVYDGTARYVSATTFPSGLSLSMTYGGTTNEPVNAGYYPVVAAVTAPGYEGGATGQLYVARANPAVSFPLTETAVATSTVLLSATANSGMPAYFSVVSGPGMLNGSNLTFSAGGTSVVVSACVEDNMNWNGGCAQATVSVSRAHMSIYLYNLTNAYTRNAQSPDAVTVPLGMAVTYLYNGSSTAPTDVGNYEVVASSANDRWQGSVTNIFTITKAVPSLYLFNPGSVKSSTNVLIHTVSSSLRAITNYAVASGPGELYVSNGFHYMRFSGAGIVELISSEPASSNWLETAVTNHMVAFDNEPLALSVSNLNAVYDGNSHAVSVYWPADSGLHSNDIVVLYNGVTTPPVNAGSYEILAFSTNGADAGAVRILTIEKAGDSIGAFNLPASLAYAASFGLSATSRSSTACSFVVSDPTRAHITEGTNLTTTGVGQLLIRAYTTASANWNVAYYDHMLTITKANALVFITTESLSPVYDGTPHAAVGWTSPTNLPLSYTYNGSTSMPIDAGSYTVLATVNHSSYSGMTERIMQVARATPTLSFPNPGPQITTSSTKLTATNSGDGDISFRVVSGPAVVMSRDQLYFSGAGTVTVSAVAAQTTNWNTTAVTNALEVTRAVTSVVLQPLLQLSNGWPCVVTGLSIAENVAVTYDGTTNAPYAAGTYRVVGTVVDTLYQGGTTGELLVVDSPQMTLLQSTNQADSLTFTWLSTTNLHYTLEGVNGLVEEWAAITPFTNMPGSGNWQSISINETNSMQFYRLTMQNTSN